jgi:murein L,D-transpeptidase YcbB/YkuD
MIHLATGIGDYDTSAVYLSFINSLPAHLNQQINQNNLRHGILSVQPRNIEYVKLQKALEKYLSIASKDTIQYGTDILLHNDSLILSRLVSQGYLAENFVNDSNLISNAIKSFQRFHCIVETGTIDYNTIRALSRGTKENFYQISLNLDRIRKNELKNRNSIVVNIPEFRLHYYDKVGNNRIFNVVVGKKNTPTPVLTSEINRIVANPYWTVPKSITHKEIIPKLKKDSTFLQRNGFTIIDNFENQVNASSIDWESVKESEFNYWIRQKNSRSNALGVIKFLFPNKHRVYLHDTQSKRLFSKNVRAYSHGCVRVQNPQELAQMILSSNKKAESNLDIYEIINTRELHDIRLDEPISIFIRYFTCTADAEGNIYFHPDIYSRDNKELEEFLKLTNRV